MYVIALNFVKIGQTVMEILRLMLFKVMVVHHLGFLKILRFEQPLGSGGLVCVSMQNVIKSVKRVAVIEQFIRFFFKMASSAILHLLGKFWEDPQRAFGGLYHCAKFGWNCFSGLVIRKFEYFARLA